MAVVFGERRGDGLVAVGSVWYKADSHPDGFSVDRADIPSYPAPKRGIRHVLLFDPRTSAFSFEEQVRELTPDEATAQRLDDLEARIATLEGLV